MRLPEKATRGLKPVGCEGYVPTPIRFGKGQEAAFFDFVTADWARNRPTDNPLPELPQKPRLCAKRLTRKAPGRLQKELQENSKRNAKGGTPREAMNQSLKSPGPSAFAG
jgi:hypothetical protein